MIRINLLPQAKRAARVRAPAAPGSVQGWFVGYFVAAVIAVLGLAGWYVTTNNEIEEIKRVNSEIQSEIDSIKKKSAQIEEVRSQIAQSQRLEDMVTELNKARLGPARVMMELSKVLSVDGGPTIDRQELERRRRENPLAGFNRSWDPRRVWLTSFQETSRACRIRGAGRTNDDVAEFLRRLSLSEVFSDVRLKGTSAGSKDGLSIVSFEISSKVNY
ncbi:MAG: PilN domain-containing protein [Myxococcales bacterium]|nr:PilN domain-containing protein [Myxococcales bacterium]